jgi:hypothetical protein
MQQGAKVTGKQPVYRGEHSTHLVGFGAQGTRVSRDQRFEPHTFGRTPIRVHQILSIPRRRTFVNLINC